MVLDVSGRHLRNKMRTHAICRRPRSAVATHLDRHRLPTCFSTPCPATCTRQRAMRCGPDRRSCPAAMRRSFEEYDRAADALARDPQRLIALRQPIPALVATVISVRAEGCHRATKGLRTSDGGPGSGATPGPVGRAGGGAIEIDLRPGLGCGSPRGRRGDAEGSGRGAG